MKHLEEGAGRVVRFKCYKPHLTIFQEFCEDFKFIFLNLGFVFAGKQRLITHPNPLLKREGTRLTQLSPAPYSLLVLKILQWLFLHINNLFPKQRLL